MGGKPTYEELEQRVKDLKRASVKRKQSEEALREDEERYRNLVRLSPDPIVIIQEIATSCSAQHLPNFSGTLSRTWIMV